MTKVLGPNDRSAFALESPEHAAYLVERCLAEVNKSIDESVQGIDRVRCNVSMLLNDTEPFMKGVIDTVVARLEDAGWRVTINLASWGSVIWLLVPGSEDAAKYADSCYRKAGVIVAQ